MLTPDVLHYIDQSALCWLATADAHGAPNVSPKEVFAIFGEHSLVIANIASPVSVRNIQANNRVCVSFIDVFVQKGYKLHGTAEIVTPADPRYDDMLVPLTKITKGCFSIHSIIAMHVTTVAPIIAPSYHLVPGTTEASQVSAAMRPCGLMASRRTRTADE